MTSDRSDSNPATPEEWRTSRSGAWAARGFDYQHLVSILILVRQWASIAPPGHLVPEGFDDCVIELVDSPFWIQAKSRHEGMFGKSEVQGFLHTALAKAARLPDSSKIRTVVVLERPSSGIPSLPLDRLFDEDAGDVFVCASPGDEILGLLSMQLNVAPVTMDGIVSDLYRLVAEASAENASQTFEERRRISPAEVERRILDRLEAEDPSSILQALSAGLLAPVEFTTPIREPAFYQGVKVRPGHVAAGLVLERHTDTTNIANALERHKHVLLTGPSGAGKSALIWLTASSLAGRMRWFEITGTATARDAPSIIRFVRSRRPTETSPIALAFDDIGPVGSDLWNLLIRELRGFAVYILGSTRQEDLALISNRSDTDTMHVDLDAALAQSLWQKLSATGETNWTHWREPFEQSQGLLLEYVHLLTQGQRLAAVIAEQVRQRELEDRNDELAIIRSTAVLCARGGEVRTDRLFQLLKLERDSASHALRRLLDEHVVLERRPGVLGGLHLLRSQALLAASHDELTSLSADTLWQSLPATTQDSLPAVLRSLLATSTDAEQQDTLDRLAETLRRSREVGTWAAILTGLGLATLERYVSSFTDTMLARNVARAHWSLAGGFASTEIDFPGLSQSEQWQLLRDAILAFRASTKTDLRSACLERLPDGHKPPPCTAVHEANLLLSCLVPICGTQPSPIPLELRIEDQSGADVGQIARLLSTAYLVSPGQAKALVEQFGGQQALLDLFRSQNPWTTVPAFQTDGPHGLTIRSDRFHLPEEQQSDPHDAACQICETLIALAPDADAAASDALDPAGNPVVVGDFKPWSKNMPRANLPAKALVAWNVAFRQILQARTATDTLTDYARQMTPLVQNTERLFRTFTEKWIQGRHIPNTDAFATRANETIEAVKSLAYAFPERPAAVMTEPAKGGGGDDTIGALLTGVLGNLLLRLGDIEGFKATATYAGSLAAQAREHARSDIWRVSPNPPSRHLSDLADRLTDVSRILHELSEDPSCFVTVAKSVRKSGRNKSAAAASRHCLARAKSRLTHKLRRLTATLKQAGHTIRFRSRPIRDADTVYWPPREIAILVEVPDVEPASLAALDESLTVAHEHLGNDWPFRAAPAIQGHILADLALRPSSLMPLPDEDFASDWSEHLDQPLHTIARSTRPFDEGIAACHRVSAILTCRGFEGLHPEEESALSHAIESFDRSREAVAETVNRIGTEQWLLARDYLDATWARVVNEFQTMQADETVTDPLCMARLEWLSGQTDDHTSELATIRLALFHSGSQAVTQGQRT